MKSNKQTVVTGGQTEDYNSVTVTDDELQRLISKGKILWWDY